jgi:hypothetical protein
MPLTATDSHKTRRLLECAASVALNVPSSPKVDGAGARLIADTDSFDDLFEHLSAAESGALHLGKNYRLLS